MKKFLLFCTVLIFSLYFAFAQKTVRVGYYNCDGTLQAGFSDDSRKSGYYYAFYQDVAEYTDWVYEYVYGSYDEIMQKLYAGEVDIVAGITKSERTQGKVLFPKYSMGAFDYSIFAPLGMDVSGNVAEILDGSRIGTKANTYIRYELIEDFAQKNRFKYTTVPYGSIAERTEAFHNKEMDFVLTLSTERMDNFMELVNIPPIDVYFAVNKFRPDILNELDKAMARLFEFKPTYVSSLMNNYFNIYEGHSLTTEEKLELYNMKKIRFGFVTNSMPVSSVDSDGKIYGLAKDVAEYLDDFLGVEIDPIAYANANELQEALLNKEIDMAFPVFTDSWTAEKKGYKQTSTLISHRVMLVYKGAYRSDLFDKIGVGKGTIGQRAYLNVHYPDAEIIEYNSRKEYFDAVEKGEVNCAIGNESILQRFIRENPEYNDLNIVYLPHTEDFSIAVNVDKPLLLEALNKAVQQIDQSAIINALVGYAYIDRPFSIGDFIKQYAVGLIIFLALVILAIVFASVIYLRRLKKTRIKEAKTQSVIREAYIATANANNAKSAFLQNMSHDIRTPVNAIIGMTAIANSCSNDKVKVEECMNKISTSSKHLLEILNNILDMSKIESGAMGIELSPFNLDDLLQSSYVFIEPEARRKNIQLAFNTQKVRHRDILGDGKRLQIVFNNLLENAVQFTQNGGKVVLTATELPSSNPRLGCYEFIFEDNGRGMSMEFQEKLFQPFMREDDEKISTGTTGTGLGLAISRNIIQMMGGDIRVHSVAGEGSKFTVTVFMEWQSDTYEGSSSDDNDNDISIEDFEKVSFDGKRALLVEDNELNAEITTEILQRAKLEVEVAPDGMEAVNKMLSTPDGYYDIIFMDIQMPIMNGYETTAVIRTYDTDYMKNIPIITMTANAFADDIAHARNAGMNEHLAKPLKLKQLLQILNRYLGDNPEGGGVETR